MNARFLTLPAVLLALACSSSSSVPADSGPDGIVFDAGTDLGSPDTGVPPDDGGTTVDAPPTMDAGMAECGNAIQEVGELCDDGNTDDGDGCDSDCQREPFCGDGDVSGDEVCDDGNNLSGDGCRSDCGSDETCGNGIRDVAQGEVCDGTDGCAEDCLSILMCGNDMVEAPEECDDGNTDAFDGCGADCREEQTLVLSDLQLLDETMGCDFSGDGSPENAFAAALGPLVASVLNGQLPVGTQLIILLHALGLEDPTMADDDSFTLAWITGEDADGNPDNNTTGAGEFFASAGAFDVRGAPTTSFQASANGMVVAAGPEDIQIPLGFLPVTLRQSSLTGMSTNDGTRVTGLTNGTLCGVVPVGTLTLPLPDGIIDMIPTAMQLPPCVEGVSLTLADIIVAGLNAGALVNTPGAPADIDLDADGLEVFEVTRTSADGSMCQPVISACVDGDGTRTEGHECIFDSAFADGFSGGFSAEAVRATLLGTR